MSYRGRPSKGCESCRSRKVKCDEAKPSCNRCSKAGHECRYRDQGDLLFRNQTAFAAQKAEESWRKRAKSHQRNASEGASTSRRSPKSNSLSPPQNSDHQPSPSNSHGSPHSETTSESSTALTSLNELTLSSEIQPDLRQLAYERFVYDFVIFEDLNRPLGEPSDALWDFLPALYERTAEGSCLKTVVTAVSYANYSTRCDAPFAQGLAEDFLGKGLKLLQKQIADKKLASTDEVLATVYLMGVFENLVTAKRDGAFVAHKEGANALLQLRSIDQFYSNPISARLYEVSFAQMLIFWQQLIGNLHSGKPPTVPIRNVVAARQHLPGLYSTSGIYVIQLIHNEATLHAKWIEMKTSSAPPSTREELHELLQEGLDLDAEFQTWESTIPPSWRFDTWQNTAEFRSRYPARWSNIILGSKGAPPEIHGYTNLKRCWIWMFYRTSRIFLLRDVLEMLNWSLRMPEPSVASASSGMGNMQPTTAMDSLTLQIHHSFTTNHLVNVLEKSCAAVLCHFTVPIRGKSMEDVPGMRGYTTFWCLGVMDAVLRNGLVPESASMPTSTSHYHDPPIDPQLMQASGSSTNPFDGSLMSTSSFMGHNLAFPSPSVFKMPDSVHPLHQSLASAAANPDEGFPRLDPISAPSQDSFSHANLNVNISPPLTSPPISQPLDPKHAFDINPSHPWDSTPDLPPLSFGGATQQTVDVSARRGWMHRVMYYMATELGIKKGLAVVVMEGYLEKSKAEVESMLAHSK